MRAFIPHRSLLLPMSDRYFVESPVASDRAVLAGAEAHHLLHVLRGKVGTRVTLFDGSGWQFDAVVERTDRNEVGLAIVRRQEIDREARIAVTLGVALPKGDRQKWLVEKVVELGVARLVPLETERGVAQPVENALERLRRGVIEACKQCGRNRLMEIDGPMAWGEFLVENASAACRLVAHPRPGPGQGDFAFQLRGKTPLWPSARRADLPTRKQTRPLLRDGRSSTSARGSSAWRPRRWPWRHG